MANSSDIFGRLDDLTTKINRLCCVTSSNSLKENYVLSSAGADLPSTLSNFYGTNTVTSLAASTTYEIQGFCYFLKTTAGTITWAPTFSSSAIAATAKLEYTGGFTTSNVGGTYLTGTATQQTVGAMTFSATPSLSSALYYITKFTIVVITNAACNFTLNLTQSAGTITPQAGSYYTVTKII